MKYLEECIRALIPGCYHGYVVMSFELGKRSLKGSGRQLGMWGWVLGEKSGLEMSFGTISKSAG